ncbi:MAG: hypothetical protein LBH92_06990 [Bacteroidales bacterium]|jgi:hypothetical protein|nr:hypothetical protein [Bacteroidales bacterium]
MKRVVCLCILLFLIGFVEAQERLSQRKMSFQGYSGGMLFHMGYVKGSRFDVYDMQGNILKTCAVEGMPRGLGGAIRFKFGKCIRIGGGGYASTIKYNGNDSYMRVGWGGLLADCVWKINRWLPYAGATVGGGGVKNLTLLQDTKDDFVVEPYVLYRKSSIFTITPFAGVEFALTPKINIVFMFDYQFELSKKSTNYYASGTRFYIGIMFNRMTY